MPNSATYSIEYFETIGVESRKSAKIIAPLVMELIHPRSVIDVGCGTGAWAAAFKSLGVSEVVGIDGDYVDSRVLEIEPAQFIKADITHPIAMSRTFDLAICLEVAEHLDERHADQLVASLTQLAPAVLFSAAIPFQGGKRHVNEQWPSYWIEKFAKQDCMATDPFRRRLWQSDSVAWWYAQNLLLFVRHDALERKPPLVACLEPTSDVLPLVHPRFAVQLGWQNRVLRAAIELIRATPARTTILLADEARFGSLPSLDRELRPFTELEGVYGGPPADSRSAIKELEDRRRQGARYIAFGWPAFWWLEHYAEFRSHLRRKYVERWRSDNWVIYQL